MKIKESEGLVGISELIGVVRDFRKGAKQHFEKKMKERKIDITIEMLEVLYLLWEKDNISQQVIVNNTNRKKSSLTSQLDNLTNRGLVQRNTCPTDRRNNLIALTAEGRAYEQKLMPLMIEFYLSFEGDVSAQELENTIAILKKVNKRILSL